MRAREFVINIPITISLNGDGSVDVNADKEVDDAEDEQSLMVPPPQQEIELQKAALGKTSPVIDDLLAPDVT